MEDDPAFQKVVRRESGAAEGGRGTKEERFLSLECRIEASDKMLQEVHAMVRGLQQLPATSVLPAPTTAVPVPVTSSAVGGGLIVPLVANLCLWPQGGNTSGRVASSAAGAPQSHVPRPMSAPWPEAQSSGNNTGSKVHTLPRSSQDLVASFATSALSRHYRVSDKLNT